MVYIIFLDFSILTLTQIKLIYIFKIAWELIWMGKKVSTTSIFPSYKLCIAHVIHKYRSVIRTWISFISNGTIINLKCLQLYEILLKPRLLFYSISINSDKLKIWQNGLVNIFNYHYSWNNDYTIIWENNKKKSKKKF